MSDLAQLLIAIAVVLAAAYLPGYAIPRALGGSRLLSLAVAPAVGAATAGLAALISPFLGIPWSLLPLLGCGALLTAAALLLRRLGVRLPSTGLDGPLMPPHTVPLAPLWMLVALVVSLGPILLQGRRPDVVLERWDTLYHLSALQRIRETGTASSLDLGSVSNTAGTPTAYPAGFHALASSVPGVEVPILLNGAVLALAVLPWILGTAFLARTVFPAVPWAPFAAGIGAAIVPAAPVDEWIHLSAIPNLTGFAALPGALAAVLALWQVLSSALLASSDDAPRGDRARLRPVLAALALAAFALLGLGLLHPNVALLALVLVAVLTACTMAPALRRRPLLALVPLFVIAPVIVAGTTPLGSSVTDFTGGLQVPWWSALGEILLGLLTVWPMALGVVLAAVWWPGLVTSVRSGARWVAVAWIVVAVLYLDAALDSSLNLSALWYRGQDRLSMPLAMLSVLLLVPGLRAWHSLLERAGSTGHASLPRRAIGLVLVLVAVVAVGASIPTRADNAAKNLAAEYSGRGRFLQQDELEAWARVAPDLDPDQKVLGSPFSGASHLYAIEGVDVYLPVAGLSLTEADQNTIYSVPLAAESPAHCRNLLDRDIGYIYQDRLLYQYDPRYAAIGQADESLGEVVFETEHSRLLRVECDPGS
ncbi:DUF6541 family protein [Brachybacterium sp. J144]|uniref:DUF6541 family protein n=1 Tax=Brachybacterium sp. J144 TaxID=3116487 RepID=UPI002E7741AC|nr:DUF6541 family protein [Brachybacterium sp. J144]MEE1649577.1 DUF6541 family protein [Brachybacterium sp. J144]